MLKTKTKDAVTEQTKEKPTPAYLQPDYTFQAEVSPVGDIDSLEPGTVYEIYCDQCQMCIRSQGQNIQSKFEKLKESGCVGCGNKELKVRRVNMSANTEGKSKHQK